MSGFSEPDNIRPPAGEFLTLSEQWATPLYRYHLIQSGDPAQAERRTRQTFHTARERFSALPAVAPPPEVWIWRVALQIKKDPGAQANPDSFAEFESESRQVQRALIPPLTQNFGRLPRRQATLLAAVLFGGLSLEQAAEVLGQAPSQTAVLLERGLRQLADLMGGPAGESGEDPAVLEGSLRSLASRIQPEAEFLTALLEEVRRAPTTRPQARPLGWTKALQTRGFKRYSWAPLAVLGLALFALSIWSVPSRARSTPQPGATPAATAAPVIPVTSGYLQPASTTACAQMQNRVEAVLHLAAQLTPTAPFLDPLDSGGDRNGTGCEIRASGTGDAFHSLDQAIATVLPILAALGYQEDGQFAGTSACPTCFQFPNEWVGKGLLLNSMDGRAILAVGWHPIDPNLCPGGPAAGSCKLPLSAQVYSLRLDLASDPIRETLKTFFSLWQAGDDTTMTLLADPLRRRLATLTDLDNLAGVKQSQLAAATISWRIRQVGSGAADLFVSIRYPPSANNFNQWSRLAVSLVLRQGTWQVANIWRGGYRPVSESAFIADPQGRIQELSINDGSTIPLSDAGFFLPSAASRVRLSPDGTWLALSVPNQAPGSPGKLPVSIGTWVLSTGGAGPQKIADQALRLAWAPNSHEFVYVSPRDPQALFLYDLLTGGDSVMARVDGPIRGLAWSPDSTQLAVSYPIPPPPGENLSLGVEISIVAVPSGFSFQAASFPGVDPVNAADPDQEMRWTPSGDQLWFLPAAAAVDVATQEIEPLVGRSPASYLFLDEQLPVLTSQAAVSISPDGNFQASAAQNGSGTPISLAVSFIRQDAGRTSTTQVVQHLTHIAALDWTGDSQSLVIAGGTDTPQPIYRLNPVSGEMHLLDASAYYLGLRSTMQRESLHLAVEDSIARLSSSEDPPDWLTIALPGEALSLQIPQGWQTVPPADPGSWALVSSTPLPDGLGLTAIPHGQLVIQVSQRPLTEEASQRRLLVELNAGNGRSSLWTPTQVGGYPAYQMLNPQQPGQPLDTEVILPGKLVSILKYPFRSTYDAVFERILGSIKFQ